MRQRFLLQTLSQLALLSSALAAHDRKVSDQIRTLPEYHYNRIPGCMVNCISRIHRSHLPHCTPDQYFDKFKVDEFIRDQDVAGCFCRDVFFLKGFSECIIETCNRPSQFYRSVQWGYDTCAAQGVDLLDPQNLPKIPDLKFLKHWGPARRIPNRWNPEKELRRIQKQLERKLEEDTDDDDTDDDDDDDEDSTTASWSTTVTSLVETTKTVVWSGSTTTVSGAAVPTTITTTIGAMNGAGGQVQTITTTVPGTPGTTATVSLSGHGTTVTVISGISIVLTNPVEKTVTATTTLTTISTQSASTTKGDATTVTVTTTATPSPSNGSGRAARPAEEVRVEIGQQSFWGPACVAKCYDNPNKAGWFTDARYKDDIHPECKATYEKYARGGMNMNDWSEEEQRKLSRCVCTHRSYVKSLSECGLIECSASNTETFAAILFGYQVCSKKGMIEFPYVNIMVEKLSINVPGNVTLPDSVGLAANGVGGAPTFPILDEDGERMMFPNAAEHVAALGTHSLIATYVLGAMLFAALW